MYPLKQSTAITVPFFAHDVNGDAVTGLTDGSFTKRISKNGAAFGAMTVTISEMENGWYSIPLSTAHSDTLGLLTVVFTNAGAKQVNMQFRIDARLPDDLAFPAVSGRSLDVDASGRTVLQAITHTGATVPTVTTLTGHTAQTGDNFARLGAPAGVSVSADIAAIEAQTDDIGAAGAGLTALATQASVNTIDDLLDTEIAAIKTQTDKLTFTIANQLDSNIQSINDVAITGDGSGTPFNV